MGNHRLLAGVGDVATGKAAGFLFRKEIGQGGGRKVALRKVKEFIAIVEALKCAFALVQGRGFRHLDIHADQSHQHSALRRFV